MTPLEWLVGAGAGVVLGTLLAGILGATGWFTYRIGG